MSEDEWTQTLPPYKAHIRDNSGSHRFEIRLEDKHKTVLATGMVRASYAPRFGIDIADSAAIQDEITRMLHRVKGRAEP